MKRYLASLLLAWFSLLSIHGQTDTIPFPAGTTIKRSATIELGPRLPINWIVQPPPPPPYTIVRGTHLQIKAAVVLAASLGTNATYTWYKDGRPLSNNSATLDLPSVTSEDTGHYQVVVTVTSGSTQAMEYSDDAAVLVTNDAQRVINISTRSRISSADPVLTSGFVVEPGPSYALLLIRAIGPALGGFGVTDPLAAPQLKLFDAAGHEINLSAPPFPPPVSTLEHLVGAFPRPAGSADVAVAIYLPAGAYSAQVSSADGSSGTVLLEIYQVAQ